VKKSERWIAKSIGEEHNIEYSTAPLNELLAVLTVALSERWLSERRFGRRKQNSTVKAHPILGNK
jgi:hypothetical protein